MNSGPLEAMTDDPMRMLQRVHNVGGGTVATSESRRLKVKSQAAAYSTRRGILDGNFFALFCDLVNTVRNIANVELKIQPSRF
jgi:hypothetical protein